MTSVHLGITFKIQILHLKHDYTKNSALLGIQSEVMGSSEEFSGAPIGKVTSYYPKKTKIDSV